MSRRDRVRELAATPHAERTFTDLLVLLGFIAVVIFALLWFAGAGVVWAGLAAVEFVAFVLALRWLARRQRRREGLL